MCVETLRTGFNFPETIQFEESHAYVYSEKWMFSHLSSWKPHTCVMKPSEQGSFSLRWLIWGVTCLGLLWKMNVFPSIFLETPYMCDETLRTGFNFLRQSIWGVTFLRFTLKMNVFPSISLETPYMCDMKPSEQGSFFWDDWFGGHIPRFTWKMNVFPSIFWEIPHMCDKTLRTGLILLEMIDLRVTCLGLL